jgi:hypothetical protein
MVREREATGEIYQLMKDMPPLIFTGRYGTPIDPRTLNRKFVAARQGELVRSPFVRPGTHMPRCSST